MDDITVSQFCVCIRQPATDFRLQSPYKLIKRDNCACENDEFVTEYRRNQRQHHYT